MPLGFSSWDEEEYGLYPPPVLTSSPYKDAREVFIMDVRSALKAEELYASKDKALKLIRAALGRLDKIA